MRAFYDSFETFTGDQELLVSMPELVDYVEGFMVLNELSLQSSSVAFPAEVNFAPDFSSDDGVAGKKVYYCIEFAVHDFQQRDSAAAADHVSLSSLSTPWHVNIFTSNREKDNRSAAEH